METTTITQEQLVEMYNEMINESYEPLFNVLPSTILEDYDQIQYRCGLHDYYDSLKDYGYYCEDME
jgi:hypothetical protein